jgi:lysophospholipase L1-like esterase
VNWDRAIPSRDFLDNDHLNPAGQQQLARLISGALHDR